MVHLRRLFLMQLVRYFGALITHLAKQVTTVIELLMFAALQVFGQRERRIERVICVI